MSVKEILMILPSALGDNVMFSGAVKYCVEKYPDVQFTIVCPRIARDLFKNLPNIVQVYIYKAKTLSFHRLYIWYKVAIRKWYCVVDLKAAQYYWYRSCHKYVIPRDIRDGPDLMVESVSRVFISSGVLVPHIFLDDASKAYVEQLVPQDGPIISMCLTAAAVIKMWDAHYFYALAQRFIGEGGLYPNGRIMLQGGFADTGVNQQMLDGFPPEKIINLIGHDVLVTACAIKKALIHIGNDSGISHLSAAMNTPTLSLFGPTSEKIYAPYGDHVSTIRGSLRFEEVIAQPRFHKRGKISYMGDLDVDMVYDVAVKLLERSPRDRI